MWGISRVYENFVNCGAKLFFSLSLQNDSKTHCYFKIVQNVVTKNYLRCYCKMIQNTMAIKLHQLVDY